MQSVYLACSGGIRLLQSGCVVFFGFTSELHLGFELVYQGLEDTNIKTSINTCSNKNTRLTKDHRPVRPKRNGIPRTKGRKYIYTDEPARLPFTHTTKVTLGAKDMEKQPYVQSMPPKMSNTNNDCYLRQLLVKCLDCSMNGMA